MAKEKTKITINGREYTILSNEGGEYVSRVAYHLNKKIKETERAAVGLSTADLLTLTSLNLTDELFKANQALKKAQDEVKLMQDTLKKAEIQARIAAKDKGTASSAIEAELRRLREQCRRLEEENGELKKGRVTSFNKNISVR
ncbi:MAG: cell division protein ZapA [Christensenellaceae bacterium]|nr:cell division protein ZapA [Christensenellaceae bacterium]